MVAMCVRSVLTTTTYLTHISQVFDMYHFTDELTKDMREGWGWYAGWDVGRRLLFIIPFYAGINIESSLVSVSEISSYHIIQDLQVPHHSSCPFFMVGCRSSCFLSLSLSLSSTALQSHTRRRPVMWLRPSSSSTWCWWQQFTWRHHKARLALHLLSS